MNIGIDIDGVLTDLAKYIIEYGSKMCVEENWTLNINAEEYWETKTFNWEEGQDEKFWNTYKDEKKFFRIHLNDGHEGSNSLINTLDNKLYELIANFYNNGWLNDTFILFASDHGTQLPGPWTLIGSQDYMIERTLGLLFFMIPNDERLYENNLYNNIAYN